MRKNNKNKLFCYSGNKEWLVDYINYKLNNNSKPLFGDISVLSNYSFMNDYINNYQGID